MKAGINGHLGNVGIHHWLPTRLRLLSPSGRPKPRSMHLPIKYTGIFHYGPVARPTPIVSLGAARIWGLE